MPIPKRLLDFGSGSCSATRRRPYGSSVRLEMASLAAVRFGEPAKVTIARQRLWSLVGPQAPECECLIELKDRTGRCGSNGKGRTYLTCRTGRGFVDRRDSDYA